MSNCLACQKPVFPEGSLYHPDCLKAFWQNDTPVLELDYELSQIEELARENVAQRVIVTGVQPKLSLGFTDENKSRLTIVGALNGRYILKPPFSEYPQMPETEALSMLMAKACGIDTVPFILIRLKDGHLAYLTRRIDRDSEGNKFAMEDACQFTERLTEHKYRGSYERIAKAIIAYSQNPIFDIVRFYEQVIVSFLIGNNDMHLKNFSLISTNRDSYSLAPAYDMISAQLVIPDDPEELALTLNGKKRKITKSDFNGAMAKAHIPIKAIENLWARILSGTKKWPFLIDESFLKEKQKRKFIALIDKRLHRIK
ncbi:HipA domain-containing protein [Muricauda sp. MAR_2010_75]|jgi:serine/threonine-protein kinase HipA|uniref:HipA domain-containing protein n=1 Tax=Allomuricauda sp. MAR_2010_75 TaxID=1250232 RepID=UPI000562FC06|nr:HipA domain-containing protein [Muricauda sp. MAR_2010_75]